MANRYFCGAVDSHWADAGNWDDTSSGGAGGAGIPTAADDVFLDSGSPACQIDAAAYCRSINCTGYTNTLTHNAAITLTIGDATAGASNIALKFVADMTYTLGNATTSAIVFASTSATVQSVDFAGKDTGNATFSGVGGSWQLTGTWGTSGISTSQGVTQSAGTLDTNDQTCYWGRYTCSGGSNARTLDLGASTIHLMVSSTSTSAFYIFYSRGYLTLTCGTSVIICEGANSIFQGCYDTEYTFYELQMTGTDCRLKGRNVFTNFTRTGPASTAGVLYLYDNFRVTGTLLLNGNSLVNRLLVCSDILGTRRAISVAGATYSGCSYLDFRDITVATSYSEIAVSDDTVIDPDAPDTNYGSSETLTMWATGTEGVLTKCDLSSLSGATIHKAHYRIWEIQRGGSRLTSIVRVLRDWGELTATWNKYDGSNPWTTAGAYGEGTDIDSSDIETVGNQNGGWVDFPITVLLATTLGATNYGWKLFCPTATAYDQYASCEYTPNATLRPFITVFYGDNVDLSAITGGCGDCGGNSGITFTTADDWYWNGSGTRNFSDYTYWYTATNGGGDQMASTRCPLPQDTMYFDVNSIDAATHLDFNMARIGGVDTTGVAAVTFDFNNVSFGIHKSLTLVTNVSVGSCQTVYFYGRGAYTIAMDPATNDIANSVYIYPTVGYTYTLASDFKCFYALGIDGTFDANDYNLTINRIDGSASSTIYCGNGTWTQSTYGDGYMQFSSTPTWNAEGSTFIYNYTGANAHQQHRGTNVDLTFNNLTITGGGTGALTLEGNTTYNTLTIGAPKTVKFTAATVTTVTSFVATGTEGNPIAINSATAAVHYLKDASGTNAVSWCTIDYSYPYGTGDGGGALWDASDGTNTDGGHNQTYDEITNEGWRFAVSSSSSSRSSSSSSSRSSSSSSSSKSSSSSSLSKSSSSSSSKSSSSSSRSSSSSSSSRSSSSSSSASVSVSLSIIQSVKYQPAATGNTIVFTITPTEGNVLVAFCSYSQYSTARTISAPDGNWVKIDDETYSYDSMAVFYYVVPASPAESYTFTISGSNEWRSGVCYEITGANTTWPINQHAANTGVSSTEITTPAVTPSIIGTLALSGADTDNPVTCSGVSVGWTLDQSAIPSYHATFGSSRDALTTDTSTPISNTFTFNASSGGEVSAIVLINPENYSSSSSSSISVSSSSRSSSSSSSRSSSSSSSRSSSSSSSSRSSSSSSSSRSSSSSSSSRSSSSSSSRSSSSSSSRSSSSSSSRSSSSSSSRSSSSSSSSLASSSSSSSRSSSSSSSRSSSSSSSRSSSSSSSRSSSSSSSSRSSSSSSSSRSSSSSSSRSSSSSSSSNSSSSSSSSLSSSSSSSRSSVSSSSSSSSSHSSSSSSSTSTFITTAIRTWSLSLWNPDSRSWVRDCEIPRSGIETVNRIKQSGIDFVQLVDGDLSKVSSEEGRDFQSVSFAFPSAHVDEEFKGKLNDYIDNERAMKIEIPIASGASSFVSKTIIGRAINIKEDWLLSGESDQEFIIRLQIKELKETQL